MLSQNQVKRLLKQSESAYKTTKESSFEGWIQALRLVLEVNGPAIIRNTELKDE